MDKEDEIKSLLQQNKTYREISETLGSSFRNIKKVKDLLTQPPSKDDELNKLRNYMKSHNLKESDILQLAENIGRSNPFESRSYHIGGEHTRFLLMGDTHIGNIAYDKSLMKKASMVADKEKVDFVVHGGDIVDGWYQNRPLQIFELEAIGFDQQLKLAVDEISQLNKPFYFITANHEYNTFMRGAGVELGHVLESKLQAKGLEAKFLGNQEADIIINNSTKYKILHPDGGTAYALSYRPQKIAESLTGGEKPELLSIHHFHKSEYLFYRNIHILQGATLAGQTKFMRGKNISAHKGFWTIDLYCNKNGQIDKITPNFYPSYD